MKMIVHCGCMANTYASAGVNIALGDAVSDIFYQAAKQTWQNRQGALGEVIVPFDDFSGVRAIKVGALPEDVVMNIGFDGVGSKTEIAERVGDHSTIAYDLLAMVCDDAVVRGAEPVLAGSILDVNALQLEAAQQLASGYVTAAKEANVVIINGEVAELGNRIAGFGNFNYNWGASVVWFARQNRLLTGKELRVGDTIVALQENGFRSNGFSLLRTAFTKTYGNNWHEKPFLNSTLGKLTLQPSRIYSAAVVDMFGGVMNQAKAQLNGVVHITGGGIPTKLGRVLKASGLGAELDNLYAPNAVMLHAQEIAQVPDEEAYRAWNMGQGMLLISPEPEAVIALAKHWGIAAQICGKIVNNTGITLYNKGFYAADRSKLTF